MNKFTLLLNLQVHKSQSAFAFALKIYYLCISESIDMLSLFSWFYS